MSQASQMHNNVPPRQNKGPGLLVENYLLLAIATILLALRCYIRTIITRNFGKDDASIILAWIFLTVGAILLHLEIRAGLGQHVVHLPNPEQAVLEILKFNTIFQMFNVLCTFTTKISITFYILRIKNDRYLRWILWTLMILMGLATFGSLITIWISCIPLKKLWEPHISGRCLDLNELFHSMSYVQSSFTIFTDLCLTASPIVILWRVRIPKGRKLLICGLMSLGLIATVSNALRNVYLAGLTSKDSSYDAVPITIVAILELSSGFIAACVPTIMPIFQLKKLKTKPYNYYDHGMSSGRGTINVRTEISNENRTLQSYDDKDTHSLSPLHTKGTATVITTV